MKLRLCIPSVIPSLFSAAAEKAIAHARGSVTVVGFGNGTVLLPRENALLSSSAENLGVPAALHRLWEIRGDPIGGYRQPLGTGS